MVGLWSPCPSRRWCCDHPALAGSARGAQGRPVRGATRPGRQQAADWADVAAVADRRPSLEQLHAWYTAQPRISGLGTVCGKVAGNTELFEFDDREAYDQFKCA